MAGTGGEAGTPGVITEVHAAFSSTTFEVETEKGTEEVSGYELADQTELHVKGDEVVINA